MSKPLLRPAVLRFIHQESFKTHAETPIGYVPAVMCRNFVWSLQSEPMHEGAKSGFATWMYMCKLEKHGYVAEKGMHDDWYPSIDAKIRACHALRLTDKGLEELQKYTKPTALVVRTI